MINPRLYIGPHFKYAEFVCKHCGKLPQGGMDPVLILKLEILRLLLGDKPIIITSGYRCPAHNKAVNGAPRSQHLYGRAADIIVPGVDPAAVAAAAESVFWDGGLGRYKGFTHVDNREFKARWQA